MILSSTNKARKRGRRIVNLLDKLWFTRRFRVQLSEIDDVRNSFIAHAAIGSLERAWLIKEARAMKKLFFIFGIIVLMMGANSAFAQTVQTCAILTGGTAGAGRGVSPTYLANQDGRANEGCTILITLNADGSIVTTFPNPSPSYDNGLDDNLIGVVNNTSKTITALQLTSATVPIFGLEDDGVCGLPGWTFSPLGPNPNCAIATDPHGYGPAGINFTIFNVNSGIVNFGNGGIAPGGNAFFSLEGGHLTKIVVVVIPGLAITKQVTVVGGGAALPGGQLDYLVHVTNPANNPPNFQASSVVITDDINSAGVGRLTLVNPPPTMNGGTTGVTVVGSVITADYSTSNGPLQPGASIDLRFRAQIAAGVPAGTTITNTGLVTWNTPTETASASASVVIGGVAAPGAGTLNGTAWLDANFNKIPDAGEPLLQGWTVTLFLNGVQLQSVLTDANGVYKFSNVATTDGTSNRYELRFTAPGAGPNTAKLGIADSAFTNSLQRITGIAVPSGSNVQNLNLPIAPNGVVYNSSTRAPIPGATLTMLRAGSPLPASCFDDTAQQGQITQAGGYYRFDLNFSDPACPAGGSYLIQVTAPSGIFVAGESKTIPAASDAATAPFSVPTCPGGLQDALPAVPFCEAQGSEFAPPSTVAARSTGTAYYLNLTLDNTSAPGSNQIYNNHIPVDQQIAGAFSITKTTPLLNVTRGQLVPYTITISSVAGASAQGVQVVDRYPAGFRYVKGSARLNGVPTEPTVTASQLVWSGLNFDPDDHPTITLLLAVGAGVGEGEFVNRAQVLQGTTGQPMSGEATATVRVVPDQTFDCTDVFGKVFDDVNRNGRQDPGEKGLPGVRVVTAQGLAAITDQYGRFHITCAVVPNEIRGSNFVLKLDDRTLPSGFRLSTDQLQIKHATAGKALKFDFGASIYRVVAIDLSDAVFEPGKTEIREQWKPRLDVLLGELRKAPSLLRLSYVADTEDSALVERRMQAVKQQLTEAWDSEKDKYVLTIEPEVFWRRGAPPKRSDVRVPESR
ncbi:MAG TPA: SdrD B-like domain-containing protein [Candidatus Sulfotelmatobacter sp.]|nr:SdrD B-like domain-containing protein [Candidatus Sulfotelmatobacter sp.]